MKSSVTDYLPIQHIQVFLLQSKTSFFGFDFDGTKKNKCHKYTFSQCIEGNLHGTDEQGHLLYSWDSFHSVKLCYKYNTLQISLPIPCSLNITVIASIQKIGNTELCNVSPCVRGSTMIILIGFIAFKSKHVKYGHLIFFCCLLASHCLNGY